MKEFYLGLKSRANAEVIISPGKPRFKYIGMWNNQLENLKNGKELSFQLPALLFEFESTVQVDSVGGGVQVFDPLKVRCHILHEFYDAKDGTMSINLDIFDLEKYLYLAFQLYSVKGSDFGSSPLNRTGIEYDTDHDNIYHCIPEYTTTWTDNSMSQPVGGYDIDPPLQADITVDKIPYLNTPAITVDPTSLNFGNVLVGQWSDLSFTIAGMHLQDDLILSTSLGIFQITWSTVFSNRIVLSPDNETVEETNIFVRFKPLSVGDFDAHINYGVPGLNRQIELTGSGT